MSSNLLAPMEKHYERLTVLGLGPNDVRGNVRYWVQCKCGSEPFLTMGASLRSHKTRSCGCLRDEAMRRIAEARRAANAAAKQQRERRPPGIPHRPIAAGEEFGSYTALAMGPRDLRSIIRYWCLCEHGEFFLIPAYRLRNGDAFECPCARRERAARAVRAQQDRAALRTLTRKLTPEQAMRLRETAERTCTEAA